MVTSVFSPTFTPERIGSAEKLRESPTTAPEDLICPRCDTLLRINYDEPLCLQCGYVDYDYVPSDALLRKTNLFTTATRYVLRYVGEFPSLADTLTHVKLVRVRNRVVYGVNCPFCGEPMAQSSLSGRRREAREERYKCTEGHRVSLTPGKEGSLGWK